MVGTFYRASSPTADPYVQEGDVVKEGQVLCIIEAMKLMNEIESKIGRARRPDPRREWPAGGVRPAPVLDRSPDLSLARMTSRAGFAPSPPRAVLAVGVAGGWWARARIPRCRARAARHAGGRLSSLTDEGIRLYGSGQFPRACDRFSRAWDDEPASAARREDVARCFEGMGLGRLRQGRPDEAMLLFRQGLRQSPGHAGPAARARAGRRPRRPRRRGAGAAGGRRPDPMTIPRFDVLLAHLYDRRDDAARALEHLRPSLDRRSRPRRRPPPGGQGGARGARRGLLPAARSPPHFLVKWRAGLRPRLRRALLTGLTERARARRRPARRGTRRARDRHPLRGRPVPGGRSASMAGSPASSTARSGCRPAPRCPPQRELERILVHEYAHAAIHDLARGRAPRWLHEGLAQALEGARRSHAAGAGPPHADSAWRSSSAIADPGRARTGYEVALWVVHDLLDRGGHAGHAPAS